MFASMHTPDGALLTSIPLILIGIVLLAFGRKLFWLFVAAIGFIVGSEVSAVLLVHQPHWIFLSALILGLIGAFVAIFVQKMAIRGAGFLAGGYFAMTLCQHLDVAGPERGWIAFLVGGVIGTLLMIFIFNGALIAFSSASGTYLILAPLHLKPELAAILFLVLVIVGVLFQNKLLPRRDVSV